MHPLHLLHDYKLTLEFSLKLVGQLNPLLHPFFESVNPGFKIYIGDYLMFDYVLSGELDDVSNNILLYYTEILTLAKNTISLQNQASVRILFELSLEMSSHHYPFPLFSKNFKILDIK